MILCKRETINKVFLDQLLFINFGNNWFTILILNYFKKILYLLKKIKKNNDLM